jgi:flagellar motility protein MotE (MotC chaperone)
MSTPAGKATGTSSILFVLAMLFLAAGMSRLGLGVAEVIAAESTSADAAVTAGQPMPSLPPDPADLLAVLLAREERLAAEEEALRARTAQLRAAEAQLARQIEALEAAEARLASTLRITETAAEDDLQRLTSVFENMKPQQAAELFGQMDTEFAAGFIARLRPDFAGEIMAGLDPVTAYAISAIIAGRHARTPRN